MPYPSGHTVPNLDADEMSDKVITDTSQLTHPVPLNRVPALKPLVLNFHSELLA